MKKLESFFTYCSGASFSLMNRAPTEKSKYVGVGATIFFTGLLASISSAYALYTVFDTLVYAIPLGVVWGLMIFNLDRYIVLSMRKHPLWYKEYLQAVPRVLLAVIIALIISKPLELKIFQKEIITELKLLQQEITREQHEMVETRFTFRLDSLKSGISDLQKEIAMKEKKRDELFLIAQQEADGTGGSGKRNPGPIYKIKQMNAQRVQKELEQLSVKNTESIEVQLKEIDRLTKVKESSILSLGAPDVTGLSFQLTALNRLGQKYATIEMANYFIILLFIALELAPIMTKLISNRGPYDDLLAVHEHQFKNYKKEKVTVADVLLEKRLANI